MCSGLHGNQGGRSDGAWREDCKAGRFFRSCDGRFLHSNLKYIPGDMGGFMWGPVKELELV